MPGIAAWRKVYCPKCDAPPGELCWKGSDFGDKVKTPHKARVDKAFSKSRNEIEVPQATLYHVEQTGLTTLILDHDKGRSVYALSVQGSWVPTTPTSKGAMDDLLGKAGWQ